MSIVIFMDGVLRTDTRVPIFEGISLYKALNANTTVMLACEDEKEALRWCKEHKLSDVDGFVSDGDVPAGALDKQWLKVQLQQSAGLVHLIITSDLELAKQCLENGVKTLAFLHPVYLSPKFRPDGRDGRKSWDAIVDELDKQVNMLMEDERL